MDTSRLGDDKEGDEGFLSHTLHQSTVWEQDGMLLSFMALYNKHN
jgi:hypothetical protein